jgi:hypothetical protein
MQLDFFPLPSSASPPASLTTSPIIGLKVHLPNPCRCGNTIAVIGSSSGPHAHRLDGAGCGIWRQRFSKADASFVAEVVTKFGCPETITIRRRDDA